MTHTYVLVLTGIFLYTYIYILAFPCSSARLYIERFSRKTFTGDMWFFMWYIHGLFTKN